MAFEYCCSLGMRVAEFLDYKDLQVLRPGKIKTSKFFYCTFLSVNIETINITVRHKIILVC
jgi:hypothetical protein